VRAVCVLRQANSKRRNHQRHQKNGHCPALERAR
jgi:hypothetical protein